MRPSEGFSGFTLRAVGSCTRIFLAALSPVAKLYKQPKDPSTGKEVNYGISIRWNIIKDLNLPHLYATMLMNLSDTLLNGKSKSQKITHRMFKVTKL